jgi:RimJ/RimL family protein N-acetyltransferase
MANHQHLKMTLSGQETLLQWAGQRILGGDGPWYWGPDAKAFGILDSEDGRIVAVAVLNAFYDDTCTGHFASDGKRKWATYRVLRGLFHYIFLVLGVRSVIASTPSENAAAIKMWLQMGFKVEGEIRKTPDGSKKNAVGQMFNVECKFIADLMRQENG